jgi:hypothetical protein
MYGRSEVKVPDGKLVRADVWYEDTIDDVELHGDFFLYPETAKDDIENAVAGMETDSTVDALSAAVVEAVDSTAELVGFGPEDVAEAVHQAVTEDDAGE